MFRSAHSFVDGIGENRIYMFARLKVLLQLVTKGQKFSIISGLELDQHECFSKIRFHRLAVARLTMGQDNSRHI